jgi:hypothetical protein
LTLRGAGDLVVFLALALGGLVAGWAWRLTATAGWASGAALPERWEAGWAGWAAGSLADFLGFVTAAGDFLGVFLVFMATHKLRARFVPHGYRITSRVRNVQSKSKGHRLKAANFKARQGNTSLFIVAWPAPV